MTRTLGIVPLTVLLALSLGLSGCGNKDEAGRAAAHEAELQADAAIDGVLHRIAAALGLDEAKGSRSFTRCGESYAPRGVVMQNFLNFRATNDLTHEQATATTARLLRDDGWTVAEPDNPVFVSGAKGPLTLRVEIATAMVVVDLVSDCIETSDDVVEEYTDRATVDLTWAS
ncbi:hypothetical protein [Pimelobacter simplex]|uniref:hypothetical protein n=1 Tax=Nocardioides simplex TaxID=2045 RepID=UPI003AAB450D